MQTRERVADDLLSQDAKARVQRMLDPEGVIARLVDEREDQKAWEKEVNEWALEVAALNPGAARAADLCLASSGQDFAESKVRAFRAIAQHDAEELQRVLRPAPRTGGGR